MKIACIAWGSLIWEHGPLKLASGWQPGGPALPLEFVRDSDDSGELALILHDAAPPASTWWALLETDDLAVAREMLRQREKIRPEFRYHVASVPNPFGAPEPRVAAWLAGRGLDAAVWTALPAKFGGVPERAPSAHEALAYLAGLQGEQRAWAEQYVRRVPTDIRTLYRGLIEERFGWTPAD